ncbi:hypothetical protein BO79DRAFT_212423 [Aspergillus costaricaensis CBS 115574]|uniref:Uncharacterized protein n=1 Tax=Aspergillus costaricaensis CBS 115574 TaxID=1448317 RepID=A0ACD1IWG6_9EURO|nr:hypothetical protein BO79DRAFT_212423 [Aspergillus costaricaensis CBS 115574]RAK94168.1 hypothetical protein BO79DRAFT_212423 [Aspergillus costaricaensis CBS 115574]
MLMLCLLYGWLAGWLARLVWVGCTGSTYWWMGGLQLDNGKEGLEGWWDDPSKQLSRIASGGFSPATRCFFREICLSVAKNRLGVRAGFGGAACCDLYSMDGISRSIEAVILLAIQSHQSSKGVSDRNGNDK